ncbi:MAG: class II glutamine amidotransferase [Gammaproteobacteria bacterium]
MCRFILYQGPPILLGSLLIEPRHSLIRQSVNSYEREEPLNGDGFGVGWYAPEFSEDPAVFRSITPAWNNRNLHNLARVVAGSCIFAHVRAATQSSGVNEANCHPFRYGSYLFMHNGDVGNFRKVRRRLLESVCDEAFSNVFGSTDSEHFFAVLIDELLKHKGDDSATAIAAALDVAISRVVEIVRQYGEGEPCYLNIAIGDGYNAVVSRYTNDPAGTPESLYWYSGKLYEPCVEDWISGQEIIVSSERLTSDSGWQAIPPNHMIVLGAGEAPAIIPCGTYAS